MNYLDGDGATLCNGKPAFKGCEDGQTSTYNTARFHNGIQFELDAKGVIHYRFLF